MSSARFYIGSVVATLGVVVISIAFWRHASKSPVHRAKSHFPMLLTGITLYGIGQLVAGPSV